MVAVRASDKVKICLARGVAHDAGRVSYPVSAQGIRPMSSIGQHESIV